MGKDVTIGAPPAVAGAGSQIALYRCDLVLESTGAAWGTIEVYADSPGVARERIETYLADTRVGDARRV